MPEPGDRDFFQRFANTLADDIETELERRGLACVRSMEQGVSPTRLDSGHPFGHPTIYQVAMLCDWPANILDMRVSDFVSQFERRWAVNMGIKLARMGVLTTYDLPIPRGVELAAVGHSANLTIRCVVDYQAHQDAYILRVDAFAKWDE